MGRRPAGQREGGKRGAPTGGRSACCGSSGVAGGQSFRGGGKGTVRRRSGSCEAGVAGGVGSGDDLPPDAAVRNLPPDSLARTDLSVLPVYVPAEFANFKVPLSSVSALTFVGSAVLVFCVRNQDHTVYANKAGLSLFVFELASNL